MAASKMWMGTREHGEWVPASTVGGDFSSHGWSTSEDYLNGGAYVRRSFGSHKRYELAWSLHARDEMRKIDDLAHGLWGDGLVYFLDPFAMDKNLLPSHWASPMLSALDSPPIIGDDEPTVASTANNGLGYPIRTATYNAPGEVSQTVYIPVPQGYTAWVGVHGPSAGGSLLVRGATSPINETADTVLPKLAVTDVTRFSHSFSGDTYQGIVISAQTNASYTGAMVQVLPSGSTPASGGFVSGQGNSGCRFDGMPATQAYSAALDKVGMTATLVEVGAWL